MCSGFLTEEILIARGGSHVALLLIAFASKRGFQFSLLAWWDEKRVLLRILNDLFSHDLALKTSQSTFNRLSLVNSNYCHSLSVFL
jgi:hypothetical protein